MYQSVMNMPQRCRVIAMLLGISIVLGVPRSYAVEGFTWEQALTYAKEHHPDLASAREKLIGVKASRKSTRSALLPQISSQASATTSKASNAEQGEAYSYGITGRQLLFDGFKASTDLAAATESVRSAAYEYEVTSSNVRLNLYSAFINLLKAQQLLSVVDDIAKRREQNVDLVTLRYDGGREHKGSLMTAKANLAQAQYEVRQAKRDLELAQRRFSKELGQEQFTPMTVVGDLQIQPIDQTPVDYAKLVEDVPLLKALTANKEAARLGVKSARADFFPQVYATAGAKKADDQWPPQPRDWSLGLSVTLPLFEGGNQQAQLEKARALYRQFQADERSGRDGVLFTLAQTWTNWQDFVEASQVAHQFLEASQERTKIVEAQYAAGLVTFNDWTIIVDDLVRNQKSSIQTQANAWLAYADWLQAKGITLDDQGQ